MSDGLETEWTDVKGGSCVTFKKVLWEIKTPFTHSGLTNLKNFGSCAWIVAWLGVTLQKSAACQSFSFGFSANFYFVDQHLLSVGYFILLYPSFAGALEALK